MPDTEHIAGLIGQAEVRVRYSETDMMGVDSPEASGKI